MAQGRMIELWSGTSTEAFPSRPNEGERIEIDQGSPIPNPDVISIDDLYPARELNQGLLPAALIFLRQACDATSEALRLYVDRDYLHADERMQQVHAHLYEAFCQRELGEGYGGVINACIAVFENSKGVEFTANQISVINQALSKLRNEPLLKFEDAIILIENLEGAGLNAEPAEFEALTDLLSSESVR